MYNIKVYKTISDQSSTDNVLMIHEIAEILTLGNKFSISFNVNKMPINSSIANIENSIQNIEEEDLTFNKN